MSEMKLWAARDNNGADNLIRSSVKPEKAEFGIYCGPMAFRNDIAKLACSDIQPGQCREIKNLDLINWTVEYVPDPPTLKEAWKAFRRGERWEVRTHGTDPCSELIKALQREFPDE